MPLNDLDNHMVLPAADPQAYYNSIGYKRARPTSEEFAQMFCMSELDEAKMRLNRAQRSVDLWPGNPVLQADLERALARFEAVAE